MDIVTYALAKKMASSAASGITEVQTDGTNIRFKTANGDWFSVRLNSVDGATVSANGHLIIELSDGTDIDAGVLPVGTMDTALSATSENGVQNKVITAALGGKQNVLAAGTGISIDNTDPANPTISANVDYTNLVNKPTKLSDFTNDEDFVNNTVNNLTNYYLKTQTYTQTEVNDLISHLASLSVEIVETLPTEDISTTTIYLVNVPDTTNYAQWMYINNTWSNIGNTSVDLTNYYTKGQADTLLDSKVDKVLGKGLSTNDFTNAYKDRLDNYTVDSVLNSTSTNPIQNGTVTDALALKQPKTLSAPIVVGGVSSTTVEGALGNLNALVDTKLPVVTSLPASPSNQETVLYVGTASGGLKTGGIYQYQVSEWVLISIDPSIIPSDASANNKLVTQNDALIYYQSDSSNITDFNNAVPQTDKGAVQMFYLGSDITNAPTSSGGGFIVIAKQLSTTYISQLATQIGTNNTYTRSKSVSGWSAWGEIATMDKVVQCVENKSPNAKTVSFELNSKSWNCGTIYGNTNNGGNFKYDYYVTSDHVELVKQDGYGQQGSITASLSGTTLTLTADGNTSIKTVTIIKS